LRKCSLCEFFEQPYNLPKKVAFEAEVNRGTSLRKLVIFLRAYGLEISKDSIGRHIKECMGRELKKEPITSTIKDFFDPPAIPKQSSCEHKEELRQFDMPSERVRVFCKSCGAYLYDFDPDEDRSKFNDSRLYHKLMREREQARKHGEKVP